MGQSRDTLLFRDDWDRWDNRIDMPKKKLCAKQLIETLSDFYVNSAPADFMFCEWEWIREKGIAFLETYADQALKLGWTQDDLIWLDENEPCRLRQTRGLAWLIGDGYQVISLDKQGADLISCNGEIVRWHSGRGSQDKF